MGPDSSSVDVRLMVPYNVSMSRIALCGYAGVGKSTYVRKNFPDYVEIALADPIKRALYAMGASRNSLWGPSERRNDIFLDRPIREWLILLGTTLVRKADPDHWVRTCLDVVYAVARGCPYDPAEGVDFGTWSGPWEGVVVPDVRWPNEARMLTDCGFTLFRLERPGADPTFAGVGEGNDLSPWVSKTVVL